MPSLSSTRAAAASIRGNSAGCTQPLSTSILRARATGHGPRATRGGIRRRSDDGSTAAQRAAQRQRTANRRPRGQRPVEESPLQPRERAAADLLVDQLAADVEEPSVLDPGRARRLTRTTGQAAIQVQLRLSRHRVAFQHLLDQIDPPARSVELVAEQLIRRTGRRAKTAVHAHPQDRIGLLPSGRVLDPVGEIGLR